MIAELAERVLATPPRCGGTRLACVDGPSGSGKTTFAAELAAALGSAGDRSASSARAPVLAMDELYPGWDGLAAAVPLLHDQVIVPLAEGRPARFRRWDWAQDAWGPYRELGTPAVLVVEGAGCGARPIAPFAALLVWLEAPEAERHRRAMARDGDAYRPHWERWAAQERALFGAEATRARADVVVRT